MTEEKRKTGIDIIGDAPWGTHFCQFYKTKEDLLCILVPYFKAGLENNEFCMWVTSEPLSSEEARRELKKKVKDLDTYIKKGQIEILDYSDWYTKTGKFESDSVLQGWVRKEEAALKNGFSGLRLTGNTFWLEKKDWKDFFDYEAVVNSVIGKYRMLAICTYSLDKCGIHEILDVVANHQFALIERDGKWKIVESGERKKAQEALKESEQNFKQLFDNANDGLIVADTETKQFFMGNKIICRMTGYTEDEFARLGVKDIHPEKDLPQAIEGFKRLLREDTILVEALPIKRKDGSVFLADVIGTKVMLAGKAYLMGSFRDITERKKTEEKLKNKVEQFERFNKVAVGRELKMRELTERIKELEAKLWKHGT